MSLLLLLLLRLLSAKDSLHTTTKAFTRRHWVQRIHWKSWIYCNPLNMLASKSNAQTFPREMWNTGCFSLCSLSFSLVAACCMVKSKVLGAFRSSIHWVPATRAINKCRESLPDESGAVSQLAHCVMMRARWELFNKIMHLMSESEEERKRPFYSPINEYTQGERGYSGEQRWERERTEEMQGSTRGEK